MQGITQDKLALVHGPLFSQLSATLTSASLPAPSLVLEPPLPVFQTRSRYHLSLVHRLWVARWPRVVLEQRFQN